MDLGIFGVYLCIPRFLDNFTLVLQLNIPKKELGSHKSGNPKTNLYKTTIRPMKWIFITSILMQLDIFGVWFYVFSGMMNRNEPHCNG